MSSPSGIGKWDRTLLGRGSAQGPPALGLTKTMTTPKLPGPVHSPANASQTQRLTSLQEAKSSHLYQTLGIQGTQDPQHPPRDSQSRHSSPEAPRGCLKNIALSLSRLSKRLFPQIYYYNGHAVMAHVYNLGSEIPMLETHGQNAFRDRCASASLDTEAQLENAPCQRSEARAGEEFPARLGQGAPKEQRQGKSQKPRCSGPGQHIPCRGKIGPERERKQMRGPSRETRGNSRHSRESRLGNMK